MKALFFCIFLCPLFISCESPLAFSKQEQHLKLSLLRQCSTENILSDKNEIYILKSGICNDINCHDWLSIDNHSIKIYSVEDLFMRGIRQYIIIEDVDLDNWSFVDISIHKQNTLKSLRIR